MQSLGILVACVALPWTVSGLKIGTFNVKVFGPKKLQDRTNVDVLCKIVSRYDVLLIEEIRSKIDGVIPTLLGYVNNRPVGRAAAYKFRISQRLGTTSSKEQYAFIYRSNTVNITDEYQLNGNFERPPFSVLVTPHDKDVGEFFLLGVHVKPKYAFSEISNLHTAFFAASDHYGTQRGIILGDFNAGCTYLSAKKYRQLSLVTDTSFTWLLNQNTYTNVKMSCPYDRIVTHHSILPMIDVRTARVFRFDQEYNLTKEQVEAVSDHYPVEVDTRRAS